MRQSSQHRPVMVGEVLAYLLIETGGHYVDGTFGGGGHSKALLEADKRATVVGMDRDNEVEPFAARLKKEFGARFRFVNASYDQLRDLGEMFDGILFDLGLSTDQLISNTRGFSYAHDAPLDMRFDQSSGQTAAQLLNQAGRPQLERILKELAEDRYWRGLAARIVERRKDKPFRTTGDLIATIGNGSPKVLAPIFQALRISVNDELTVIERGLQAASECLKPGGVLAVISFHSVEDRLVKNFLRSTEALELVTKKPVAPSELEIKENPASRSAKLRVAKKVDTTA